MKIYPVLRFKDARTAHSWLQRAFGFEPHALHEGENGRVAHAQMAWGDHVIMFADDQEPQTAVLYLSCEDPDALFERATGAGAEVLYAPRDTDYGSREFGVRDPDGNSWSFGTYEP